MNAKVRVSGFCIILTEQKWKDGNLVPNVSFTDFTKKCIKSKIAYTSDVERENYDDMASLSRKIVFPCLNVNQLIELMESSYLSYDGETMGALTIEYGWIPATSFNYQDYSNNQDTNAYISVLFDFDNFENVEKESHCMQSNYTFQENLTSEIMECLKDEEFETLEEIVSKEFNYDLSQLEIQFENQN